MQPVISNNFYGGDIRDRLDVWRSSFDVKPDGHKRRKSDVGLIYPHLTRMFLEPNITPRTQSLYLRIVQTR